MVTLAVGKAYEARISLRKELREKKAPVYEELVHRFFDIFYAEQMGKPKASQMQYMEFFIYGIEKLTAWGSNKAVRTFGDLRNNGGDFVLKIEAFLMALREDLGHSASDMPPGSILRLFVNDIDEHIEKVRLDHSTSTERLPPR